MEWIEVRGRTMAEAIERALDALGVHESELDYEVLAEPKTALFGLRRTEAHIRARVMPLSREKPADRRRRRGREGGERKSGGGRNRSSVSGAAPSTSAAGGNGPSKPRKPATPKRAPLATADKTAADTALRDDLAPDDAGEGAGAATGNGSSANRRRRSRGGRNRNRNGNRSGNGQSTSADRSADPYTNDAEEHEMPDAQQLELAATQTRDFVEGLLDAFDIDGEVEIDTSEDAIDARVVGDNLGVLVGAQGATLASIEELLRDSVGHQAPGVRLHLDVAGYRARRRAALADFALRVAAEVVASGSAKALEPMPAADRKVVHDAVAEVDGVVTVSDGEEPRRRVVIKPAG